jgi:hypothetical protein
VEWIKIEKTVITALIGILASVGYVEVSEYAEPVMQEATAIAGKVQARELSLALELYRIDHNTYPRVDDEALIKVLYNADLLKSDEVPFSVSYSTSANGKRYSLEVL